jgi:hypothetical protein
MQLLDPGALRLPDPAGTIPRAAGASPFSGESGPTGAFRELVGQFGREIAAPMAAALERVNAFAAAGRMDRASLRALREEIEGARRIGLQAQQLARFAGGRVRQDPRRLNLTQTLRDALARRQRETASRGIDLRQQLGAAEVITDASALSVLLQALLDWSFEHARSHIEFGIDVKSWPVHARLMCRFAHVPADELPDAPRGSAAPLDSVSWQLLRQMAQTLGLVLRRHDGAGDTQLTLEFPRTIDAGMLPAAERHLEQAAASGPNSQPMVGRHVLVVAAQREIRNGVRDTLRSMGLMVDYVGSVDEAREFCAAGLPHAIVYEAGLAGENFRRLRTEWSREPPAPAFIEIAEQGRELEVCDLGGQRTSRIGRDVIAGTLGSALMFELAQAA